MANRLMHETSPYLLQHAENPVDWYAWGEEALQRAKQDDKPILLSVGYSACHWCHVMAHESFEDPATAAVMNELFVNIKVDREERPDIDSLYMAAVQAMTRHGGWPMTVFLTPDGAPFYGGTYFPPEPRHNMPSFQQVLHGVAEAYRDRREEVFQSAEQMREHLEDILSFDLEQVKLSKSQLNVAAQRQMSQFDSRFGGYGGAPKFPQALIFGMVLRTWLRSEDQDALNQVTQTLQAMANGGMYDQLGGGFARYSVDAQWLVPHFEKMLYDNALLSQLYLETYQATHEPVYRRIAEESINYILRDMTSPDGGFYAAEDADSEGEEGKFYVWSLAEIQQLLSPEDAALAQLYWNIQPEGNFEGHAILYVPQDPSVVAKELSISEVDLAQRIAAIRATLLAQRNTRIRPGRDEKILASWNGMMLRSLAFAANVLDNADYRAAAIRNAEFITSKLYQNGQLYRSYKDGQAKFKGYLEDYACVADGMLALYEATFDLRWLHVAIELAESMTERFWDAQQRSFFDTASDHEQLITRPRDLYDNATPAGNSVAVDVLLRLATLLDRYEYRQYAETVLANLSGALLQLPGAFGRLLAAADFALAEPREVALIGDPADPAFKALLQATYRNYQPNKVVAACKPDDQAAQQLIPLLAERPLFNQQATAYVCVRRACKLPTNDPNELINQLG